MVRHRISGFTLLLVLFVLSASLAPARGAGWEPLPLWGGEVRLAAAADLSVVYAAAANGGLYQSTDGGVTWHFIANGPPGHFDRFLKVDPFAPRRLYLKGWDPLTFFFHLYRSEDGGRRWQRADAGFATDSVADFALDPSTPGLVYAATSAGVFRSRNRGISWSRISDLRPHRIAVTPADPDVLLAMATLNDQEQTLRSTDGGRSFDVVFDRPMQGFVFDPTEPRRVFGFANSVVYQSDDLGATWTARPFPWALQTLAITPAGDLLSGDYGSGIRRSPDGGLTWTPAEKNAVPRDAVSSLVVLGDRILAGGVRGIWRGTADGLTWRESSTGLGAHSILALAVAGDAGSTLWASTPRAGVFVSRDGGASFQPRRAALGPQGFVRLLAVHPRQPEVAYAFGCCAPSLGLLKTEDAGESWRLLPYGGVLDTAEVLEVDPRDPDVVYAGGDVQGGSCNVVRSTDGGATWSCMTPLAGGDLTDLAIDPRRPRILYALSGGSLYRSETRGASWARVSSDAAGLARIEVDPFRPERLYALLGSEVLRSDNGGRTWRHVLSGGPTAVMRDLLLDPGRRNRIWATAETIQPGAPSYQTTSRVFRSDDAGERWTDASRGLKPGTVITDLAADPRSADVLYAGTDGSGLFRLGVEE